MFTKLYCYGKVLYTRKTHTYHLTRVLLALRKKRCICNGMRLCIKTKSRGNNKNQKMCIESKRGNALYVPCLGMCILYIPFCVVIY